MRILFGLIVVAALTWSGLWVMGARLAKERLVGWFAEQQDQGRVARNDGIAVRGFPNRLDATVTAPELADPATGWGWSAPFVQIMTLSYRPNHVIVALPDRQNVGTPLGDVDVASERLRASAVFDLAPGFPLDRATLVGSDVALTLDATSVAMAEMRLAVDHLPDPGGSGAYRVGADLTQVTSRSGLDLPSIDEVRLDATLIYDTRWQSRGTTERPRLTRIEISDAGALWADAEIGAEGTLDIGPDGRPVGQIDLRVENWRMLLNMAEVAGLTPAATRARTEQALGFVEMLSGTEGVIEVPLIFEDGRIMAGPMTIGPAPRLERPLDTAQPVR
ncbi:hypothetical protein OCGS_0319 [Oceaniovalibus guishaninsula JLT2003]|uniref:DUF2125 domain-containing protein n=1 Tax=Oceaniovalibus guishaninsula JLT2003 TaxID=1231392 RepID=K2HGX5_9RHOB|nr:DUF2125 domain-containing protein [Oceaniovalibus guishaninsula]EKE45702.1 hypothetical protein OCGS_0319 [Oceaniovalibus guishaninsula JLT2003]